MLTIARIFGKSPFAPLQVHIEKVAKCLDQLPLILEALAEKNTKKLIQLSKTISKLEHEADLTKNDLRNHLPSTLFMPIDRATLLEILSYQDSFADLAEDISVLVTLRPLENYDEMKEEFEVFFLKNVETFFLLRDVVKEFDTLLESSFGGIEAKKVKEMIVNLALKEHELDKIQFKLMQRLYNNTSIPSFQTFHLWLTLIREVGAISNLAEKLGNRIRMILEVK